MDANTLLWIGQIVLALGFGVAGSGHAFGFDRVASQPRTAWMHDVGRQGMRTIGLLELAGAVGVIVPAATGILPWLTPVAAAALGVLMLLAAVYHARRPGEHASVILNLVVGAFAFAVAYGRFVVEPL